MTEQFDPYYTWLGIPPEEQPPNCYRLLGLRLLETNPQAIENAADRQMSQHRTFQVGPHSAASQKLLNEVAAAKICLLNPAKKAEYDRRLRAVMEEPEGEEEAMPAVSVTSTRRRRSRTPVVAIAAILAVLALLGVGLYKTGTVRPRPEVAVTPPPKDSVSPPEQSNVGESPDKTSGDTSTGETPDSEEPVWPPQPPKEETSGDGSTKEPPNPEELVSPPEPLEEETDTPVIPGAEPPSLAPPSEEAAATQVPPPVQDEETPEVLRERLLAPYGLDENRTPAERQKTARMILDAALTASEDRGAYRVLLTAAAEEARESGHVEIMTDALGRLSETAQGGARQLDTEMLVRCAENIYQHEQANCFASLAEDLVLEHLLDDSRHEEAKKLDAALDSLSRKDGATHLGSRARVVHKSVCTIVDQEKPLLPKRRTLGEWRDPAYRAAMLKTYGGTAESERAVEAALEWLASVQFPDGGWCFDHGLHPDRNGKASDAGSYTAARNSATGIALLPFLAAGNTHRKGTYKETVAAGLDFLSKRITPQKDKGRVFGGSLAGKGEFGHVNSLCGLAFAEAFAMTGDKRLQPFVKALAGYSLVAQDPVRGGWDLNRIQGKGQIHASLNHVQFLFVANLLDQGTVQRTTRFLNTCEYDGGARYHVRPGDKSQSWLLDMSGLYLRVLLGSNLDDPGFKKGIEQLKNERTWQLADTCAGLIFSDLLFQADEQAWRRWNSVFSEKVLLEQEKEGVERGSWCYTEGGWRILAAGQDELAGRQNSNALRGRCDSPGITAGRGVPQRANKSGRGAGG